MGVLIVYESMYGNTRAIAESIAEGWGEDARACPVREAERPQRDLELLVVGGPTQIHGLSTSLSRHLAISAGLKEGHVEVDPDAVDSPGLRRWLHDLPGGDGLRAAAFDTRLGGPAGRTGSAARGIARRLEGRGYHVEWTESFLVSDGNGPLADGELERARAWGATLRKMVHVFTGAAGAGA